MDSLIVTLIVGLAVAYIFKSFYKKFKKGNKMSCECSGCNADSETCKPVSFGKVKKELKAAGNKTVNCDLKRD